jgi:hypothetical protein
MECLGDAALSESRDSYKPASRELADEFFHFESQQGGRDGMAWEAAALDDGVDVGFIVPDGGVDLRLVTRELRRPGWSELGFFGKEDAHVVEDVGGGGDEFGPLLDEAV